MDLCKQYNPEKYFQFNSRLNSTQKDPKMANAFVEINNFVIAVSPSTN